MLNFDESLLGEKWKLQLLEIEEMRLNAYESSMIYKQKIKVYHEQKLMKKTFQPGQQVLLFNSRLRLFIGKLDCKRSGPIIIKEVKPYGAVELVGHAPSQPNRSWIVNGQ